MSAVPDFSSRMLKAIIRARVTLEGFRAAYPNPPRMRAGFDAAKAGAIAAIRKRAGITEEQMRAAMAGRAISLDARTRLWTKGLGVDPGEHGVRLLPTGGQEALRNG